jgi:hypothetical protein
MAARHACDHYLHRLVGEREIEAEIEAEISLLRTFKILLRLALALAAIGCDHADRLHPNPPQCDAAGKDCR